MISISLKIRLSAIPTIVASAIPLSSTAPSVSFTPLIPVINTMVVRMMLLALEKSTFCSTKMRRPEAAMTPNSRSDTPPMTGEGIFMIRAENVPEKDSRIAIIAAPPITQTE
ncbi:hypothetical protein D1872_282280 [compost metagenome]